MTVPLFDLHCHSTYSDGSLSVKELLALAKQRGISGLAITDHDTFASFYETGVGDEVVKIIPGIEISSRMGKESIHVLGYSFDPSSNVLVKLCELQAKRRMQRNREILAKLCAKGMMIAEDEIVAMGIYGRVHIAALMVKKGYVDDIAQAFSKYIGDEKCCYVPAELPSVDEVIACIHQAKGKAVLAHPHLIKRSSVVRALMGFAFDGIEAQYGNFSEERSQKWVGYAEKNGWFITGGSDFHGEAKPHVHLGSRTTDSEVFLFLYNHFLSHSS